MKTKENDQDFHRQNRRKIAEFDQKTRKNSRFSGEIGPLEAVRFLPQSWGHSGQLARRHTHVAQRRSSNPRLDSAGGSDEQAARSFALGRHELVYDFRST